MTPASRAAGTQAHRQVLGCATVVVVLEPLLAWAVFVVPGWV